MTTGRSILRAATRVRTPWRNGGGVTSEIAVFPEGPDLEAFDWRLSIAEVAEAGEFSQFDEVERTIGILRGTLHVHFDGDAVRGLPPHCAPVSMVPQGARASRWPTR